MSTFLTWLFTQIFLLGTAAALGALVGHFIGFNRACERIEENVREQMPATSDDRRAL